MHDAVKKLGFSFPDSMANFIFAKKEGLSGEYLYEQLKEKGILIRFFNKPKICDYIRITIGTQKEMESFIDALKEII